jgi:hypothetical protein
MLSRETSSTVACFLDGTEGARIISEFWSNFQFSRIPSQGYLRERRLVDQEDCSNRQLKTGAAYSIRLRLIHFLRPLSGTSPDT